MSVYKMCVLMVFVTIWIPTGGIDDVTVNLVRNYFELGYNYREIIGFLLLCHNTAISLRTLQRVLRRHGLRRNGVEARYRDILNEMNTIRREGMINIGYRTMYHILNGRGVRVTEKTTRVAMRLLDAGGADFRRRRRLHRRTYLNKGPNYLIHIDGHDKLKPFGIAIHGAMDGFSRRIIWLKAGFTNNDPRYIARFYMEEILHSMKLPRCIRSDEGTENCLLKRIHEVLTSFHHNAIDEFPTFITGRSTGNQRIEMFWGILHNAVIIFWKNFFKDLRDSGLLDESNPVHIECIRYCFMSAIQRQLDEFTSAWNRHRIRLQRNTESPSGVPNVLHYQPEMYRTRDYSLPIPVPRDGIIEIMNTFTLSYPQFGCSEEFVQLLEVLSGFQRNALVQPINVNQGLALATAIINALQ